MRASDLALTIAVVAGSLAVYHFVVPRGASQSWHEQADEVERLTQGQAGIEARLARLEGGGGTDGTRLEARLARLEARAAVATSAGANGAGAGPKFSEADVETARGLIEEVDRRRRAESEREQVAILLDRTAKDLRPDTREVLIDRIVLYLRENKAAQAEISKARTAEEREAATRRLEEVRARLAEEVERDYPELASTLPWIHPPKAPGR